MPEYFSRRLVIPVEWRRRIGERCRGNSEESMTQNEKKTFQVILKEKCAEMTRALRNREGILIEKAADELDEITTAFERDIAIQKLDRESRLLRQILGALSRIEDGTFGTCLHCDEEISRKRLAAVPWTPFCLACQDAADRGDERVLEAAELSLAEAA
jgi:DnaK suppressor protein